MTFRNGRAWPLALAALVLVSMQWPERVLADAMSVEARTQLYKRAQISQLFEGAERRAEAREHRRERRKSRTKSKAPRPGEHREVPADVRERGGRQGEAYARGARRPGPDANPLPARLQAALAPNVIVNNRVGDHIDAGQAEISIAAIGTQVVAAWNDGEGFYGAPGSQSTQGFAYSNDGGQSWSDGGVPPLAGGVTEWTSDPVLTVNEKTGAFYYAALCNTSATTNGVAVVRGTFSGGTLTWGTPKVARSLANSTFFLDKPWVVADSTSGNLYLSYSTFDFSGAIGTNRIEFQRQTDPNNATSWGSPTSLSSSGDAGRVQGSRPAVGPNGEVYVVWYAIGTGSQDFYRIRKSTSQGTTFGVEITVASIYANFGSGAPGFNRGMGISFPSISVDRSTGNHRGRIYVAWNESVNFFDDAIGTAGTVNESETNDTPGTADLFTLNQAIHGAIGTSNDFDYFRFNGTAGQTIICSLSDPTSTNQNFIPLSFIASFRLFCADGTSRLAFSDSENSGQGLLVFTLPVTGAYYLRVASLPPSSGGSPGTGSYVIDTGTNLIGPERARDHRDAFVAISDNSTSWFSPVRVNDEAPLFDDWLPEVSVSPAGKPYVVWYDWRDSPPSICASGSHVYLSRSDDNGGSWLPGSPVTESRSDWTNILSDIAPNQGDYLGLFASGTGVFVAWADGRNGDADGFMARVPLDFTAATVSLASVTADRDGVRLVWQVATDEPSLVTVYRRTTTEDWTALAEVTPDGTGLVRYEDRDVTPGGRYGYRIGVRQGDTESFGGEAWVDVPTTTSLSLQGARPNPANGPFWISFSLPTGEPATLEVLDVMGRRVRSRDVGSLGPGSHVLRFDDGAALAPGVYVVRLVQGSRTLTSRVTLVR